MDFIDEDNRVSLVTLRHGRHILEHRLQPLLKLASELGTCEQRRHVEGEDTFALEAFGHLSIDDALGKAFHNRCLANTGFTDEDRVVLGSPLQDLNATTDLIVPANDRVELARQGPLREIDGVLLERLTLAFGLCIAHGRATPNGIDGHL